ncbi:aldo/keto reductase [Schaalia sp. 19OD2882]|uniref:aldo/keto reductase n=1 Tax=Schaalia sp. 19OD2882 TaxID=2794089 RepID=UPI001C1E979E|nr:aldo/keto reductase [Schaalia sp. 19OD2882]QWW18729.1 aldo/keto reductase [Schaalia sp. 19OD2882]
MEHRLCAHSGLRVSELGLGTLTWGRDTEAAEALEMFEAFLEAGGTVVEGAPWHGDGAAPDVIGSCLPVVGRRHVVIVWRGGTRFVGGGTQVPSSAAGDMLASLDDSLQRLGTDHVDLWLACPDPDVPLDESLSALERAHRSGRAAYVGLSHRGLWDTSRALAASEFAGRAPVVAIEEEFSLLRATQGRELRDRARAAGIAVIGHSPLAGGVLTGKYRRTTPPDSRAASEHLSHLVVPYFASGRNVVEALARAAQGLDRSMADVALVWAKDHPGVASTIVGPRTLRQLESMLAATEPLPTPIRSVLDEVAGL